MSKLAEFRAAEKALQEQLAYLESFKNDAGLKREIKFEEELKSLMKEYDKNLRDIVSILDPDSRPVGGKLQARGASSQRKARAVKVYKNPNSGEIVETKGGNHKVLKAWKAEFGNDVVESWLQN
ncbi:histone-like nucleoid-structuring protein, MvaT/MvaU family [Pseudomonas aeruginosa]|uniref:histone-like nucleoid-structuring protein, MvaT/MvaU family n=1 Tax=Pseudomonas TaxID=286 RepID=UPI00053DD678|nr:MULTISPECIES: histone-like nucleoid-structuring protein, MvaT/MvaU family [Pseudomonas]MBM2561890.1 DNA binding protein [Pseudomonas sp. AF1]MBM2583655.1 DNA binding protein [Pseudomonas sp. AFW1]MBM2590271.1 DNA binding protein [Pseudomonas sp. BIS]MBM2604077.1 DNA binding protein [Pseudomonas sp. BIS1]ARH17930.1 transcriptional regulator [Pseudomonas aeruginosa]